MYPIRIIFTYSTEYDVVLTSIETRMNLSLDEVLSNLVPSDAGKRIFYNPGKTRKIQRIV